MYHKELVKRHQQVDEVAIDSMANAFEKIQKMCIKAFQFENVRRCSSEIAFVGKYYRAAASLSDNAESEKALYAEAEELTSTFRKFHQLAKAAIDLIKTYNNKPIANHLRVDVDKAYLTIAKCFENIRKNKNVNETIEKAYVDLYRALAHHAESIPHKHHLSTRVHPLHVKINEILTSNQVRYNKFAARLENSIKPVKPR